MRKEPNFTISAVIPNKATSTAKDSANPRIATALHCAHACLHFDPSAAMPFAESVLVDPVRCCWIGWWPNGVQRLLRKADWDIGGVRDEVLQRVADDRRYARVWWVRCPEAGVLCLDPGRIHQHRICWSAGFHSDTPPRFARIDRRAGADGNHHWDNRWAPSHLPAADTVDGTTPAR